MTLPLNSGVVDELVLINPPLKYRDDTAEGAPKNFDRGSGI